MRRLDNGDPIRAAMRAAGLDLPRLAARIKELDPDGGGLSRAYVGFITGQGRTAREECGARAATLIARALDKPLEELFEAATPSTTPRESTSARKSQTTVRGLPAPRRGTGPQPSAPEVLLTQVELAAYLRKSSSWIDSRIQADPNWPVRYVGRSRRFDPVEVLAYEQRQRQHALA